MKDRTNEEGIDPVTDGPTDNARRRGESESCHGEKHGAPQERTLIEEILETIQWKQPRTRRRHLLALGADPATVHMATRSRKGYWRMSQNEIVRFALNNRGLEEQGVPDMRAVWIVLHYGPDARV